VTINDFPEDSNYQNLGCCAKNGVLTGGAKPPSTPNYNHHWATCLTCLSLYCKLVNRILLVKELDIDQYIHTYFQTQQVHRSKQESPADADKPARRKKMQKLLQFDLFRFISPNSISPNFKLSMHSFTRYV